MIVVEGGLEVVQLRLEDQRTDDAERMAALVAVARALGDAGSREEVLAVLTTHGAGAVGAQGAGLCLRDVGGRTVRVLTNAYFEDALSAQLSTLPADLALPIVRSAVDGTSFFFPDRATVVRDYPHVEPLYAEARTEGSAEAPLWSGDQLLGSLSLAFAEPVSWREEAKELVEALAAMTAQAVARLQAREAEHEAAAEVRRLSEGLQRSLLPELPVREHLELVARYLPAAEQVRVGGDWYDAFVLRDGTTCLVIGDVAGHDSDAAVGMSQLRNLLRGVAHSVDDYPGTVLRCLDGALADLAVDKLATVLLAEVEQDPTGNSTVRWSNAGHLPPLVLDADGSARFLDRPADLLLGLDPDSARHDHTHHLLPGSTVLLYTDGLVERRGEDLSVGLQRLLAAVTASDGGSLDELCDGVVRVMTGDGTGEDDVALLAVRTRA